MKAKSWFIDAAKGASLGTGILPGVSVGTVGLIVRVYDKLISSIAGLRRDFKRSFLTLLPIALGCIVSAIILLVFWKKVAYAYFPFIMIAILAGFVIGGLPLIKKELSESPLKIVDFLWIGLGCIIAASIGVFSYLCAAGIINLDLNFATYIDAPFQNWWIFLIVFVVGFIAAVSCLIPGISGSMILFIFGLYNPIVGLFISDHDASGQTIHPSIFRDTSKLPGGLLIIFVLLLGILAGFLLTSKAMKKLLEKHRRGTFLWVLGFVFGSLVSMFVNNDMYFVYNNPATNQIWQFVVGGVLLIGSAAATFFLIRKIDAKEKQIPVNEKEE